MHKAFFWDRDGTLIVDKHYLNDPDGIEFLPGVFEAMRQLEHDFGFIHFIVTNQSGIASGKVSIENLQEIHRRMTYELRKHGVSVRAIEYSPHSADSNHPMRKPNPGMILKLSQEFDVDLKQSYMAGDRESDVLAGQSAGCRTILIQGTGVSNALPQIRTIKPDVTLSSSELPQWVKTQFSQASARN